MVQQHIMILILLVSLSSAMVPLRNSHGTLQQQNEDTPIPSIISASDESQTKLLSLTQPTIQSSSELPLAGQLFIILACTFTLLSVMMYVVQQVKYFQGKFFESKEQAEPSLFDQVFNDTTLGNARGAMLFTPVIGILMLFLMFRAVIESIDEESTDYKTVEFGMGLATVGILLQAADGFSIRLHSDVFGNLSESLGNTAVYIGYAVLLWGVYAVRQEGLPMSIQSKLIVASTILLIGTMLIIKFMELKKRYFDTRVAVNFQALNDAFNESRLEEIRQTASFVPFLMVVLFYVNFRYLEVGSLPHTVEVGFTGTVVTICCQTVIVVLKSFLGEMGKSLRILAVLATNIFFLIGMIALVYYDWPGPSIAVTQVHILLFAMSVLKVAIVVIQELSQNVFTTEDESSKERFTKLATVSQSMMNTAGYGEIICILLLFWNFRAVFLLGVVDFDHYIAERTWLESSIYLATIPIYVQMAIQAAEAFAGVHSFYTTITSLAIAVMHVGLVGVIYYIAS